MPTQKIFLFGIDFAGKTSLSQALRTGQTNPDNKPTQAFDITNLILRDFDKKTEFKVWDAPGQLSYRTTWGKGLNAANMMIFVLDTADKKRFEEAKKTLRTVVDDLQTRGVPLIFLYHKMDTPEAKNNLLEAKSFFKSVLLFGDRKVYSLETSVNDPASLTEIKKTIGNIVQATRWG